ncbi:hypothetical protein [Flavobacterium sp.]|uniref:hypothetical protein n=1 Tax=Flavobacterium sp. TaxID=239 RepID=UPI0011FE0AD8|nr:hypothetical protein [Flavobacterium sp.]RZJ71979.1 MAG: hypothetical protein EOO49_08080 [Flavobacterium sp.]
MKKFLAILLLLTIYANGQSAKVVAFTATKRTIHAHIGRMPVAIFLKVHKQFAEHDQTYYSVQGWYRKKSSRTKIPIVGVYNGSLTLFRFDDKNSRSKILDFESKKPDLFSKAQDLEHSEGYAEKFSIAKYDREIKASWESGNQKMPLYFAPDETTEILEKRELLVITAANGKTHHVNLLGLIPERKRFSFVGICALKSGSRVLLNYEYTYNQNSQGRCGAGIESGYVTLLLDKNYKVTSAKDVQTESCNDDLEVEKNPKDPNLLTTNDLRNNKVTKWRIDAKKAQIIKVN